MNIRRNLNIRELKQTSHDYIYPGAHRAVSQTCKLIYVLKERLVFKVKKLQPTEEDNALQPAVVDEIPYSEAGR
ncbi:hypothetical protein DXN04_08765 [Chitinophaga silvisoli]|uniref:Uncharacterized protein n=1 Tax=Chitinophaga silvisoli TaxID=2291814 RepID=A0A3E1P5M2_9BACT|nr:hypothetical protein DXN04_08765 [Chitinophaga silvisoli]